MTLNPKPRVLIVDSERVIAYTLSQIFSKNGFETKAVYDTESAVATSEIWRPNLAILDFILLKKMNGLEFAIHLCDRYPDCGIILLHAQVAPCLIQQALQLEFTVFAKPIDPQILLKAANDILEVKRYTEGHP